MRRDPESTRHFLPTLDGWRAIAISLVLASHAFIGNSADSFVNQLTFRAGTFGVMLFFAISGYLICTRLLIEEETHGYISLRTFYIRRVFRILPPAYFYLATVAILGALFAGAVVVQRSDLFRAALFYSNYVETNSWFTGHFWSLAMEEHFYLLWPPILFILGRKRAMWACVAIIALSLVLRYLAIENLPEGTELPGYTHLRLDAFMFPCILAILLRSAKFAEWFANVMKPLVWISMIAVLAGGIALGIAVPEWRDPQRALQSAIFPILIATTVLRPGDWFAKLLQLRPLEYLGRISYSVYLWQQLIFGLPGPRLIKIPLILIVAAVSRRWIEEPMIDLGRKLTAQKNAGRR
jgi:peptidoglycan/LPS O-acetylase OafA/YrhL